MFNFLQKPPPIVHFQQVAGKVGFPERNGPLIYLPFCNLHCDYCLNTKVVGGRLEEIPFKNIEKHIKDFNESFVFISGGEPCFHKTLHVLVKKLKKLGVKVGISTNGTYFDSLKNLIETGLDFVAMDIKTDLRKYEKWKILGCSEAQFKNILKSVYLINSHINYRGFGQEFRTTLYPPLVEESDIEGIMEYIVPKAVWILQQFRPRKGLLGGSSISEIKPYSDETLYNWEKMAKTKIANTHLRWP